MESLCFLHECANHDDPSAGRRNVKRASNSVAAGQPQLPQLPLKVLDVRFTQAFKPSRGDALRKPKKARLHVGWKSSDLCGDGFVEDLDSPRHKSLYLNFEI